MVTVTDLLNTVGEPRMRLLQYCREGMSVQQVSKIMPIAVCSIYKAMDKDPSLRIEWDKARKEGADTLADSLLTTFDDAETVADAMIGKAVSDNIKSIVGWRNPGRYGAKLNVEVTHTIDLSSALQQAEHRTITILEQAAIDRQSTQSIPPVGEQDPAQRQLIQVSPKIFETPKPTSNTRRRANSTPIDPELEAERNALRDKVRRRAEQDWVVDPHDRVSNYVKDAEDVDKPIKTED